MVDDGWYESEESTRQGMIVEIQRIQRRTLIRPVPVLVLAALITTGVTYALATRKTVVEAEVVLALSEGSLSMKDTGLPVEELREYVTEVLLPDSKLLALIERRNLYPSRARMGDQFAIDGLRSQLDVQIWKNTFLYGDDDDPQHSARIGLTVSDTDPDRAFDLARDLASIVIQASTEHRQMMTTQLASEINDMREQLTARVEELTKLSSKKELDVNRARAQGKESLAQAIDLELAELWHEQKGAVRKLGEIAQSRDALADRISAAGLDMTVQVVEEHRPRQSENRSFVMAMIAVVIGFGALLGSAVFLGVFDSRVHDADDVERLGLVVLGHLPGFPGDEVGSLESRGIARRRVPSFLRWRSHR